MRESISIIDIIFHPAKAAADRREREARKNLLSKTKMKEEVTWSFIETHEYNPFYNAQDVAKIGALLAQLQAGWTTQLDRELEGKNAYQRLDEQNDSALKSRYQRDFSCSNNAWDIHYDRIHRNQIIEIQMIAHILTKRGAGLPDIKKQEIDFNRFR